MSWLSNSVPALNRQAYGTHKDGKMALGGKEQHDVNSAGHTVTDGRKKNERLAIAVLASAIQMNNTPRSVKELPFSISQA